MRQLLKHFPDIQPQDVLLVTSRSIIVEQTATSEQAAVERLDLHNEALIRRWNNAQLEDDPEIVTDKIQIATYNKFISLTYKMNYADKIALQGLKIIVFDECHTLFADTFITNIVNAKTWIRNTVISNAPILVIGMTATPSIFDRVNDAEWIVDVSHVLDDPAYKYKIKKMTITDVYGLLNLYRTGAIRSNSLIMAPRKEYCSILTHYIPNSAAIIGSSNRISNKKNPESDFFKLPYQPYMDAIRAELSNKGKLPEIVTYHDYLHNADKTLKLKHLITTSTLREGFNLRKESGVNTIVCIACDEMTIAQFSGRCRYDLDHLIVIKPDNVYGRGLVEDHVRQQHEELKRFLRRESDEWLNHFKGLLAPGKDVVSIYGEDIVNTSVSKEFAELGDRLRLKLFRRRASQYITLPGEEDKVIRDEKDKEALVKIAKQLVLFKGHREDRFTFRTVCSHLKKHGYEVVTIRRRVNYEQKREYIIRLKENNEEDDLRIQLRR